MAKYALSTVAGLLVGILAVWWIDPDTSAGASMLLLLPMILANAVGFVVHRALGRDPPAPAGEDK